MLRIVPTAMVGLLTAMVGLLTASCAEPQSDPVFERDLVRKKFEAWRQGTGSPFELLAKDAAWTIEGRGRFAGTFDREALETNVVAPFNALLGKPLRPTTPLLYQDGNTVIAVFGASATLKSGEPYTNRYAWFMTFEGGQIVKVNAFLDLAAFQNALDISNTNRQP
ncbi:MAG: nuclear transport factor 2 family protein [Proteobacteria bacterium]|nr:nuclear transport factor 2 family protein [Pseudomonadota bacterium]